VGVERVDAEAFWFVDVDLGHVAACGRGPSRDRKPGAAGLLDEVPELVSRAFREEARRLGYDDLGTRLAVLDQIQRRGAEPSAGKDGQAQKSFRRLPFWVFRG
jgi:hypothetical protein